MKNTDPTDALILGALALLLALLELVALVAVHGLALVLTLASPGPRRCPAAAPPAPPAPAAPLPTLADLAAAAVQELEPMKVADLRRLARRAGLPRALSRTGRRDALLAALAGLEVAMPI